MESLLPDFQSRCCSCFGAVVMLSWRLWLQWSTVAKSESVESVGQDLSTVGAPDIDDVGGRRKLNEAWWFRRRREQIGCWTWESSSPDYLTCQHKLISVVLKRQTWVVCFAVHNSLEIQSIYLQGFLVISIMLSCVLHGEHLRSSCLVAVVGHLI